MKQTLDKFLISSLMKIRSVLDPACSITLIIGDPANPDSDVVFSDNPRHAQIVLCRRIAEVEESIKSGVVNKAK
ncbi:MAG TPA: hypothetical protein VJM08_10850 [Anaerolineales bacterium]|nr:hypothetical protein [Anaerolineales bacterium]